MSFVKYRVKEVAADFGVTPKEIAEIVGKYSEKPKSNTQVLTDVELNAVFDYMTQHNQIASMDVVFAVKPAAPKAEEPKAEEAKAEKLIQQLFKYYCDKPQEIPAEYRACLEQEGVERAVLDYLAGMTDTYVCNLYRELFLPKGWEL